MGDQVEIKGDSKSIEDQLIKSKKWVEALATALGGLLIVLVITVIVVYNNSKDRDKQEGARMAPLQARVDECEGLLSHHVDSLYAASDKIMRHVECRTPVVCDQACPCPVCPIECPPPPACPTAELDKCRRDLNWREQKVEFGEWFAKLQAQADEKIAVLRAQYFTLVEQFQPLAAKAKEMGIGPRARDWINKPEAVNLYLELGDRWAEIQMTYSQMEQIVQQAQHTADMTCYQNLVWSWEEIMPDRRDYDRLQQESYRLTDGNYHVYLYELERRERNQEAAP